MDDSRFLKQDEVPADPAMVQKEFLMKQSPEQLDQLAASNFLSPDMVAQVKALQQAQATQFPTPFQAPTPLQTNETPAEEMANPYFLTQMGKPQADTGAIRNAAMAEEEAALAQQEGIQEAQKAQALRDVGAEKRAADNVTEQDKLAAQKAADEPKKAGMSTKDLIFAGLGAFAQGYHGLKSNPYLDALDKQVEQEAVKKKLNAEQALALRKQALEEAKLRLEAYDKQSDSALKKAQIQKIYSEIQDQIGQTQNSQDTMAKLKSGQGFTAEEVATMQDEKLRERMAEVRPGVYMPAANDRMAVKLQGDLSVLNDARYSADKVKKLIDYFGNNPLAKMTDRAAVAESNEAARGLVGALRLPYFGPGVLTDSEQQLALNIIRRPDALFALESANKAGINAVIQKINASRRNALRTAGVPLPPNKNELKMQAYRKAGVKLSDAELMSAMIKKGDWDPNEE
jgi:hypothetical protein